MRKNREQIGGADRVLWLEVGGSHPAHATHTPSSATALGNQSCWERALGQLVQPQGAWMAKLQGILPIRSMSSLESDSNMFWVGRDL